MLTIKKIEKKDIERICQIEKETFTDAWTAGGIRDSLDLPYTVLLGAWLLEDLVGYVICYCAADEGEIARIAVDVSCRRKGAALRLLEELRAVCSEKGIRKFILDVRKSNESAVGLYKKFGFAEDGVRKNFYTRPSEDAVLMSFTFGK